MALGSSHLLYSPSSGRCTQKINISTPFSICQVIGGQCHGFMIFGYQYSTSQHHAVYWELKSKCSSSGYLSGREELRSPEDRWSTVIIPAQGNRYKACRSPDLGLLILSCLLSDRLTAATDCMQGFSISVRPLALGQSFSQLYLILLTIIILNYIIL